MGVAPTVTYPGSDVPAPQTLGSMDMTNDSNVSLGGSGTTAAVPDAATAGAATTKKDVLTVKVDAKDTEGQVMSSLTDVTWKLYSDGSSSIGSDLSESMPTGVALKVASDKKSATLQLAPEAVAGTYWLKVANSGDSISDAEKLTVTKVSAAATSIKPFVTVGNGTKADAPDTYNIYNSTSAVTYTFSGEVYDQYGAKMSATPTYAFAAHSDNGDLNIGDSSSIDKNDTAGTLTLSATNTNTGKINLTMTSTVTKTIVIHIANGKPVTVTGDAVAPAVVEYRSTSNTLGDLFPADGPAFAAIVAGFTVKDASNNAVTGTWGWDNGTAAVTAGTANYTLKFTPDAKTESVNVNGPYVSDNSKTVAVTMQKTITGAMLEDTGSTFDRAYDGTDALPGGAALQVKTSDKIAEGDTLTLSGLAGKFTTAAASDSDKTVTVTALTLGGTNAGKYRLSTLPLTVTVGTISRAALTLAPQDTEKTPYLSAWNLDDVVKASSGLVTGETLTGVFGALTADGADLAIYTAGATGDKLGKITLTFYTEDKASAGTYIKITEAPKSGETYYVDVKAETGTPQASDNYTVSPLSAQGTAPTTGTLTSYAKLKPQADPVSGGSGPVTYTVTYKAGEHGAFSDGKVTLTERVQKKNSPAKVPEVTAAEGWTFIGWSDGTDSYTGAELASYSVIKGVTFTAQYAEKAMDLSKAPGYMKGVGDNNFAPDNKVNRAEIITILSRLCKSFDENGSYTTGLTDVPAGEWYAKYMGFAVAKGILKGYEDGTYHPTATSTRAEAAILLARFMDIAPLDGTNAFPDLDGVWGAGYINALAEKGIIKGNEVGSFMPGTSISRAELVAMVNRAIGLNAGDTAQYKYVPVDVDSTHWAYGEVMASINEDVAALKR